jgi:hypothetical protein
MTEAGPVDVRKSTSRIANGLLQSRRLLRQTKKPHWHVRLSLKADIPEFAGHVAPRPAHRQAEKRPMW